MYMNEKTYMKGQFAMNVMHSTRLCAVTDADDPHKSRDASIGWTAVKEHVVMLAADELRTREPILLTLPTRQRERPPDWLARLERRMSWVLNAAVSACEPSGRVLFEAASPDKVPDDERGHSQVVRRYSQDNDQPEFGRIIWSRQTRTEKEGPECGEKSIGLYRTRVFRLRFERRRDG